MAPPGPAKIPSFMFAILIASVAYGIAITLFITSLGRIIRKKRATGKCNLPFVIPSVLIFILATVNIIGLWYSMYLAFVVYGHDPAVYLGLIRTPAKTVFQVGEIGAIILTDALVVYRTWIIWNHNFYVITIPCLTFAATVISGVYFVNLQHHTTIQTSIFTTTMTEWTITFLMCSFFTTVYSTGFIVFKLWRGRMELQNHGVLSTGSGLYNRITRVLVESAALYSLNHLLYVILYEVQNQVEITTGYLEANIATITCSLIIIRSEAAFNDPSSSTAVSLPTINFHVPNDNHDK